MTSAPYLDIPRFLAWAPIPVYYSTIASSEIVAAPGAILYGASNLQTSSYIAGVSFRTDALQPAVELSLQTMFGSVGAGIRCPKVIQTFPAQTIFRSSSSGRGCRSPSCLQRSFPPQRT